MGGAWPKGRGVGRGLFRARPRRGSRAPRFLSDSGRRGGAVAVQRLVRLRPSPHRGGRKGR